MLKNVLFTAGLVIAIGAAAGAAQSQSESTKTPREQDGPARKIEIVAAKPKAEAFAAVVETLSDSSFTLETVSAEGGLVRTGWRDSGKLPGGGLGKFLLKAYHATKHLRVQVVVLPLGTDSSRIDLSGEYRLGDTDSKVIDSKDEEGWKPLEGIAAGIEKAVK